MMAQGEARFSIGEVAEQTGLSPDAIRVWERRYGRPVPVRLPSGHRRYRENEVVFLRRVAEGVARGHRPSKLLKLSAEDLDELLERQEVAGLDDVDLDRLVGLLERYELRELRAELLQRMAVEPAAVFVERTLSPLLQHVGRAWADGRLDIRHEHLLSGVAEDVLRQRRIVHEGRGDRQARIVLATLPSEQHALGLQMASYVASAFSLRLAILGPDTPVVEIVETAKQFQADAVGISVSLANAGPSVEQGLRELREHLPPKCRLIVGGEGGHGARRPIPDISYFDNLEEFADWLRRDLAV